MSKQLLLLLFILFSASLTAQQKVTINGRVLDASNGEVLIGMRVTAPATQAITVTNEYGFYSLVVPRADTVTIIASGIGFVNEVISTQALVDQRINISLTPANELLDEISITADPVKEKLNSTQMSVEAITARQAKVLPAIFGEVDIIKTLQLKAGVSSGSEGSSGLYVRGGAGEQNLILLDEATVYNANHLFGFFSTFNADAIQDVKLYKGGFPAQYGGRLSSVIDVRLKDGNNQKFSGSGGIGLIASRLTLEGPIGDEKTSFVLSGRRTYADVITGAINNSKKGDTSFQKIPGYNFYDLNAKVNTRLSENDRLYLSGYFGKDVFSFSDEAFKLGFQWGNATGTARWNHIFNPRLFANTTLIFSNYFYNISNELAGFNFSLGSKIRNYSVKSDISYHLSNKHQVRAGLVATYYQFTVGRLKAGSTDNSISFNSGIDREAMEYAVYVSDEFELVKDLKVNVGLRVSAWAQNKFFDYGLEHRLALNYQLNSKFSVKGGYARMKQYVHLVSNSSLSLPTDVWYPSTTIVHPELSDQISAGYVFSFGEGFVFTNEYYYKWLNNQVDFRDNANLFLNEDLDNEFEFGRGYAYGAEVSVEKLTGKLTGWVAYTLAKVQRGDFPDIMGGRYFSPKYDRRHDLKVVASYQLSKRWTISATWVYGSGDLAWLPSGRTFFQDIQGGEVSPVTSIYGDRNSFRLPAYHRGDLSVVYNMFPRWGKSNWTLSIYNVYDRRNPFFILLETEFEDQTQNGIPIQLPKKITAKQVSLFPILPSITYNFNF